MKLLIVDDDVQICEGLATSIPWSTLGITQVDSFLDGCSAYEQFSKLKPDICIVDIRMPRMDGLQFLRQIKPAYPQVRFIMLSAYSDFSYCQEAMENGANYYELKPVNISSLIKKVKTLIDEIARENNYKSLVSDFLPQALYQKELNGTKSNYLSFFQALHMYHNISFSPILLTAITYNPQPLCQYLDSYSIQNLDMEYEQSAKGDKHVILIDASLSTKKAYELRTRIALFLNNQAETDCFSGISAPHNWKNLKQGYLQADQAHNAAFWNTEKNCFLYDQKEDSNSTSEIPSGNFVKQILEFVDQNQTNLLSDLCEQFYSVCKQTKCTRTQFLSFIELMNDKLIHTYTDIDTPFSIADTDNLDKSIGALKKYLSAYAQRHHLESHLSSLSVQIMNACRYIHQHYHEPITLKQVADHARLSPNYFSYLFKKETGESFSSYLSIYRLTKAKERICTTHKSITAIAEEVGYHDYGYFFKSFKKVFHKSPTAFR